MSVFYTYYQQPSASLTGFYDLRPNAGISKFVIIEAANKYDADERLEALGCKFGPTQNGYNGESVWVRQTTEAHYWLIPKLHASLPIKNGSFSTPSYVPEPALLGCPEGYIHYEDGDVMPFRGMSKPNVNEPVEDIWNTIVVSREGS